MLTLRLALRELRGAAGAFAFLVSGIALGTAAITAIGLLSSAVLDGMRDNARASIGGDVSLRLYHRPPPPDHLAAFRAAGRFDLVAELRTSASRHDRSALVELKAIGDAYPLHGALRLDPAMPAADATGQRDGIWGAAVAETLLTALGAKIDDVVTVGDQRFELRTLIKEEPDRSLRAFTLGPRMIVARRALAGSRLIAPGAQVYWYSRIRLRDGIDAESWITGFERDAPHAGYRIVNAAGGVPGAERTLALVSSLLTFAAAGILLIGCVGVAHGVTAWLDGKRLNIAILKSLGAQPPLILRLYLAQVAGAAAGGVAAGLAAGCALFLLALPMIDDWLPVSRSLQAAPLLMAGGVGFLAAILFSLLPLARAEVQTPQIVLRSGLMRPQGRLRPRRLIMLILLAALLAVLVVRAAPLPAVTAVVGAAGIIIVLVFVLLGRLMKVTARAAGRQRMLRGRPLLRLAVANLHRPGAPTVPLIMAIGLCLTLVVAVDGLRRNADRHLASTLPVSAPGLAVLNLDPMAGARFDALMAATPDVVRWKRVPFLHARITSLKGQAVSGLRIPADVAYVVRGDRGVSWQAAAPANGLSAGKWWAQDYDGPPLASLDAWAADRLGVGIGDTLTLSIMGAPVQARIANLRRIDRAALDLDFPILLSHFAIAPAHREIAGIWTTAPIGADAVRTLRSALSQTFPDAPVVVVAEITAFLSAAAEGMARALGGLAAVTAIAAFLVLTGAVAAGRRQRLRQTILLKTVGATRRQTLTAAAIEFAITGGVAALAALALGNLAAWGATAGLIEFRPVLGEVLPWLAAALAVPAAAGLAITRWALSQPAGLMLRRV